MKQRLGALERLFPMPCVLVVGGPWMLNQLLSYTTDLWSRIPTLIG